MAYLQNASKAWCNFGAGLIVYIAPYWCMLHTNTWLPKARHQWRIKLSSDWCSEWKRSSKYLCFCNKEYRRFFLNVLYVCVQDHKKNFSIYVLLWKEVLMATPTLSRAPPWVPKWDSYNQLTNRKCQPGARARFHTVLYPSFSAFLLQEFIAMLNPRHPDYT
jgi:hypothetical protein